MIPRPRLEKVLKRVEEIETLLARPEVASDPARVQPLAKELAGLSTLARSYREFLHTEKEIHDLDLLLREPTEAEMEKLYREEKKNLLEKKEASEHKLEEELLGSLDPDADRSAMVEIRAGTGGEEAALFVSDLFRMYTRYAQAEGFQADVMTSNPTGKGGFKEIIFEISGPGAYRRFRHESGIHRVQRVPETEASGRIHTSAVTVAVLPAAEEVEVEINPTELRIDTFRSSGPGGQHVNKTDSAVRLTHLPTGLVVSCQDEKSQHKNRVKAMRILRTRLLDLKQTAQQAQIQKTRRMAIGTGDRSGKIRTYNFPNQRVTDHRIGLTLHNLDDILNGHLEELYGALEKEERARRLAGEETQGGRE